MNCKSRTLENSKLGVYVTVWSIFTAIFYKYRNCTLVRVCLRNKSESFDVILYAVSRKL